MSLLFEIAFLILLFALRSQGVTVPGVCFGLSIGAICISGVIIIWKAGKAWQKAHGDEE